MVNEVVAVMVANLWPHAHRMGLSTWIDCRDPRVTGGLVYLG
jgi:hypothetical protein